MADDDALIEHVKELLSSAGRPTARKMFGGCGIYLDDQIIGLVSDGRFYLKIDEWTRPQFAAAGSEPFVYDGNGKPVAMSYWTVPDEALESAEAMQPWARLAQAAALRKASAARGKSGTRKTSGKKDAPKPKPKTLAAPFKPRS
jgi:DNA transformation protein